MAAGNQPENTSTGKDKRVSGLAKGYLVAYNVLLASG